MTFRKFEDMEAWQESRQLAREIYHLTHRAPFSRDFVLRDQLWRSAISIVSNIAEGFERDGNAEFIQFLSIAKGSCGELRAQIYLSMDIGYIDEVIFTKLSDRVERVSRLLHGLIRYLKATDFRGRKHHRRET